MVNMTLAIPDELHRKIRKHPEVKWSEVARRAIENKAAVLEMENEQWRKYAAKHALEGWDEADELIEY